MVTMMEGMSAMMGGMAVVWLIGLVVLLLVGAAAIKYLFYEHRKGDGADPH